MNRKWIALIIVSLLAGITGCGGNMVRGKVERSVEQSLPSMIGPAQSYSVRADGSTSGMLNGKLRGLDIIGLGVQLSSGINITRLNANVRDISFDPDTRKIKSIGLTEFSASLSDAELTRYLKEKYPRVPGLGVAMQDGYINISAKPGVSIVKVPIRADAGLKIRDERILALTLKEFEVVGINAPEFAVNYLESKLDVIFDAKDLGFDAKIKSVVIGPGSLTLNGTLDLMKMLEKQNTASKK